MKPSPAAALLVALANPLAQAHATTTPAPRAHLRPEAAPQTAEADGLPFSCTRAEVRTELEKRICD